MGSKPTIHWAGGWPWGVRRIGFRRGPRELSGAVREERREERRTCAPRFPFQGVALGASVTKLSPKLRDALRTTAKDHRPTGVDRARILAELQGRVGAAATLGTPTTGNATGSSVVRALTGKVAVVGCTALVLIAGAVLWMPRRSSQPTAQSVVPSKDSILRDVGSVPSKPTEAQGVPSASAAAEPPMPVTESVAEPAAKPVTKRSTGDHTGSRTALASDSISEEAAILSRAQAELRLGRAARTLQILAEHERRFKQGILAQERRTVRIQALCMLGRVAEANALMQGVSPQSLTGQSVRQACSSLPSNLQPK